MAKQAASIVRNLALEAEAAKVLVAQMSEILGQAGNDDQDSPDQLYHDMVEGETDLLGAIDKAVEFIAMDEAHIEGLKLLIAKIQARLARKEMRIDTTKVAILTALEMANLPKHEGALATISQAKTPVKLIVVEESQIESKFFAEIPAPPPQLDKRALLTYLKERQDSFAELAKVPDDMRELVTAKWRETWPEVKGAEMSNGGTRLNIRFK